jgi:ADP-dependent phosphofructokinase/glucokinase
MYDEKYLHKLRRMLKILKCLQQLKIHLRSMAVASNKIRVLRVSQIILLMPFEMAR